MRDRLTFTGTAARAARLVVERSSLSYGVMVEATDDTYIVTPPNYPLSGGEASLWEFLESISPYRADWSLFNLAADVDIDSWASVLEALATLRPIPAPESEVPC